MVTRGISIYLLFTREIYSQTEYPLAEAVNSAIIVFNDD